MKKTIPQFAQEMRMQYPNMYDSIDDVSLVALILHNAPHLATNIDFGHPVPHQLMQYASNYGQQNHNYQNPTYPNPVQHNPNFQNNYPYPQQHTTNTERARAKQSKNKWLIIAGGVAVVAFVGWNIYMRYFGRKIVEIQPSEMSYYIKSNSEIQDSIMQSYSLPSGGLDTARYNRAYDEAKASGLLK